MTENNAARPMRDPINEAILLLTEEADSVSDCHTRTPGDWAGEPEAKAHYDHVRSVVDALSKLRAPVADERAAFDAVSGLEPPCASRRGNHFREGYLEARADALRVLGTLASAPVAGEAQPSDADITNTIRALDDQARYTRDVDGEMGVRVKDVMIARAVLARYGHTPLPMADAAPQASAENVRNAALEEAAAALEDHRKAGREWVPGSLWDTLSREAAARIRALKQPQADKDGSQQRAGDDLIHALGECRDAFPTPDIAGSRLDLLWQEAMSDPTAVPAYVKACAAHAALSAPQAEQGERDAA